MAERRRRAGTTPPGHGVWDTPLLAPAVHAFVPNVAVAARRPVASTLPLRAPAIHGQHVGRLLDQKRPEAEAEAEAEATGVRRRGRRRFRKAHRAHKLPGGVVHQDLSPWDLLWPVLQPPIALDVDDRTDASVRELPQKLYDYQVEGVRFLCGNRYALLADEMGTGKTVMSCVALRLLFRAGELRNALIVCPLSLLSVWDAHLEVWAPELRVTVVHGGARSRWRDWRSSAHVHLTTYDTLRGDVLGNAADPILARDRRAFDLVLLDEAQNVKNTDSGRTQAVRSIDAKYRWALSGTPVENRIDDVVGLFTFVRPGLLPPSLVWTPAEVRSRIAPHVLRRTKADVMTELPPKTRVDEWLELDEAQVEAYRALEQDGCRKLDELGEDVSRVHVFSLISELKRVCNFAPGQGSSPKSRAVREKVAEIRDNGGKVLVFSQWVQRGVNELEGELGEFGVVRFDGSLSATQRAAAVQRFRDDPDATVFLATVQSAGVGLTLTEASYVIHFDHWWNPAWMWQAEDRAHRRGQELPVTVYSLWMAGTIEERIQAILEKKGLLHEEVVEGIHEEEAAEMISLEEWVTLLRG